MSDNIENVNNDHVDFSTLKPREIRGHVLHPKYLREMWSTLNMTDKSIYNFLKKHPEFKDEFKECMPEQLRKLDIREYCNMFHKRMTYYTKWFEFNFPHNENKQKVVKLKFNNNQKKEE